MLPSRSARRTQRRCQPRAKRLPTSAKRSPNGPHERRPSPMMTHGLKFDQDKPASYLLAHDVVINDHNPSQDIQFYAARLREWWNLAGTLPRSEEHTSELQSPSK